MKFDPAKILDLVERDIGVPRRVFESLDGDDDWTFVIKLHGILEAALNDLLVLSMGSPGLRDVVGWLDTSNPRTGKVAFVKAYGLLWPEARAFIKLMSNARNYAVHDVKNFGGSLEDFMGVSSPDRRKDWKKALACWIPQPASDEAIEAAFKTPRVSMKNSCMAILIACLANQRYHAGMAELHRRGIEQLGISDPSAREPGA